MNAETIETSPAAATGIEGRPLRGEAPVPSPQIQLKNILVPVDFSELSLKSLQYAIPLAQQFGAKLTLLYVLEPLAYSPEFPYGAPLPPDPAVEIRRELTELCRSRIPAEVSADTAVCEDFAHSGVVETARDMCADLIIMTTHGRTGISHLLMGSTVEKIVRQAPCPVLVLNQGEHEFV